MKLLFPSSIISVITLLFVSCTEENQYPVNGLNTNDIIINADISSNSATKTELGKISDKYYPVWSTGDKIGVVYEQQNEFSPFSLIQGAGSVSAKFVGEKKSGKIQAFYPYDYSNLRYGDSTIVTKIPETQEYAPSSFFSTSYPMISYKSDVDETLRFINLFALLKVSLKGSGSLKDITFKAHDELIKVNGSLTVNTETFATSLSGGSNVITITSGQSPILTLDKNTYQDIYIALPPQKYSGGFTLSFNNGIITESVNEDVSFERSQIRSFSVDVSLPDGDAKYLDYLNDSYNCLYYGGLAASSGNLVYGDILAGDANKGSDPLDQADCGALELYDIHPDNSYLKTRWERSYEGIENANHALQSLYNNRSDVESLPHHGNSTTSFQEIEAEARFLRAYWHFEALKVFGASVPYMTYDEENDTFVEMSNIDDKGNYVYIWDKIAEDFKFAYLNLPDTWDYEWQKFGNKWAAASYLAKLYVYQSSPYSNNNGANANLWEDAKELIETIISNGCDARGNKYRLADTYQSLFEYETSDWNGETIFDVQLYPSQNSNTSAIAGLYWIAPPGFIGGSGWGFYQPSAHLLKSFLVQEDGTPMPNYESYVADGNRYLTTWADPYSYIDNHLDISLDPRADFTVWRGDVPLYDWGTAGTGSPVMIRNSSYGGLLGSKKYHQKRVEALPGDGTWKNAHLLRFADLLLLYAECQIQTNDLEGARLTINEIRSRAAKSYVQGRSYKYHDMVSGIDVVHYDAAASYKIGLYKSFSSKSEALTALKRERRLELGLEGHRWFDLCRWGNIGIEINVFLDFEKGYLNKYANKSYSNSWISMPIPEHVIGSSNGHVIQNEVWK